MTVGIAKGVRPMLPDVLGKQQAFPSEGYKLTNGMQGLGLPGLTKREWFAGVALSGLAANADYLSKIYRSGDSAKEQMTEYALSLADRLLERLCND